MKKFTLLSSITSLSLLVACGGGGDSTTSNIVTEPYKNFQGTYVGAAKGGDFATYTVNGTVVSYKLNGPIFGQKSGSFEIEPMVQGASSNTHFWKSKDGNVYMFLSRNLGLAYIPNASPNGDNAIVVGLREVGDISQIIGKTFVYVDITTNGVDGCEVAINSDNTFTFNCLSGSSGSGCWKLDQNNNRLLATTAQSTNCSIWDGSNPEYYVVAKPPTNNGRAGFILDHTDGSGIGIGLEKKQYNLDTVLQGGQVQFETLDWTVDPITGNVVFCQATVTVYKDQNTGQWKYSWKSSAPCNFSGEGVLEQNCYYDSNNNSYAYNGVLCAYNQTLGNYYNVMVDIQEGYYIAVKSDGSDFEIGALKE